MRASRGALPRGTPSRSEQPRLDLRGRDSWIRYGIAVVAVAAGLLLRMALSAQVGEGLPTYITFYPAVMVAALLAGLGPGLLATALTLAVVHYWILSPQASVSHADLVGVTGMVLFASMGVFLSVLAEFYRRLERELAEEAANRALTETKRQALASARNDLERTVERRTAELRATNARLRDEIEARHRREKDLSEAELRYRTVADFTYDWEYWKTPDGVLLYCSPSCERITGHTAAELMGDPGLLARLVHPEDRDKWRQHDCEALAEPACRTIVFRIQREDGEIRWIEHICQPVIGDRRESVGVRASNRDITDRKQADTEMQHLRQELIRIFRITAAGQLAAAMAHELNQPLGAIVCNAHAAEQYLGQTPPALSEVREIVGDIGADGQRAGNVIRRLRALYDETGEERTALQLNKVIQDTIELMHSEFVLRGISVQLDLEPALPQVSGNSVQLQQVMINLVVNALDAMAAQEPDLCRLHIGTDCPKPRTVGIHVRDSGTGLTAEQLSRLGEPFFTTKPRGMGIGLAISYSIMEAHGGRLWAENNPDRGATFHLDLPVLSDSSA